jgi:hypothetical protein
MPGKHNDHNWSERVRAPSASFRHDGTTIIIDFFSSFSLSFFLFSTAITVLPERVVVGFPNFAWAPKINNKNLGKKKI